MLCRRCSPCYPDQGDLNSEGEDVWAFCVPPELMSNEWLSSNGHRIKKVV